MSYLSKARRSLIASQESLLSRCMEPKRICRITSIAYSNQKVEHAQKVASFILKKQLKDGGWSDTEETIWCAKALCNFGGHYLPKINDALKWLKSMQHPSGGWGLTNRDMPRIPTTSLALALLPQLFCESAFSWLENEWAKDMKAKVKLTYKGGLTLMAFGRNAIQPKNPSLIEQTLTYLAAEQIDDGGFGPWKNHPIGSDPWSTGITLVGLTSYPGLVDKKVIERAVEWLCKNQLPSGYWKYHFIDEGSAYAYWGLTEALKFLGEI